MSLGELWQKLLLREMIHWFGLLVISLFILFSCIDLSLHSHLVGEGQITGWQLFGYYLSQFSRRAPLFLSLSFLLAFLTITRRAHQTGEFIALYAAGISCRRIFFLFFLASLSLSLLLLLNEEFIHPLASRFTNHFERNILGKSLSNQDPPAYSLLSDGSLLFYQTGLQKKGLVDLYWVAADRSSFFYAEKAWVAGSSARGAHIARYARDDQRQYRLLEESAEGELLELSPLLKMGMNALVPAEEMALSQLWWHSHYPKLQPYDRQHGLSISFHKKLLVVLFPPLLICALASSVLPPDRRRPSLLLYAGSLFGLIFFAAATEAEALLAERCQLSPALIFWVPFSLLSGVLIYRCARPRGVLWS